MMSIEVQQEKMIIEEQRILDELIEAMDRELLELDSSLTKAQLEAKRIKDNRLPDTYGLLIQTNSSIRATTQEIKMINQIKDELYDRRLELTVVDEYGTDDIELKVGYHKYMQQDRLYVMPWYEPVCRHFAINENANVPFNACVWDSKRGKECYPTYTLNKNRKVTLRFDKVKKVTQLYPAIAEDDEKIIADEFLEELLSRRSDREFRAIVFSIQKHQGEIVQSPFKKDIIVQGCAGSGKSMIMLHRLPILLFDNPNTLQRSNLYIITPSQTYIQMAENMRYQLEISDLNMGTLKQYYDYVIEKYGRSSDDYGKINYAVTLNRDTEKYIYSEQFIDDILLEAEAEIVRDEVDVNKGLSIFNLSKKDENATSLVDGINKRSIVVQSIISKNEEALKSYFSAIRSALDELTIFWRAINSRKVNLTNAATKIIGIQESIIETARKELLKLNEEKNGIEYEGKREIISEAEEKIELIKGLREALENDTEYFSKIDEIKTRVREIAKWFEGFKRDYEQNSISKVYEFIGQIGRLIGAFYELEYRLLRFKDPYEILGKTPGTIFGKMRGAITQLGSIDVPIAEMEYYEKLIADRDRLTLLSRTLPLKVYRSVIKKLGAVEDEKGDIYATVHSPYIFLQVLYQCQGAPNVAKESLITIDEAQGVAPVELMLIKNVNDNKVVFNLFGDEKQHIEETKGVDSWDELAHVAQFERYNMLENYRNARQITEYCNARFNMQMRAINLDGQNVCEYENEYAFKAGLSAQLSSKGKIGLCAIIVKNADEAQYLKDNFAEYADKMNNMTNGEFHIHRTRWNIITVDEAKGLEFASVVAMTGRMTQNEKYISFTRALDELFVYDEIVDLSEKSVVDTIESVPKGTVDESREKKDEIKPITETMEFSQSQVKTFFESKGLKVVDMRDKGGALWVLGSKGTIDNYVQEACDKFKISGGYSFGLATGFKPGWYTKNKK